MSLRYAPWISIICALTVFGAGAQATKPAAAVSSELAKVERQAARFAPAAIGADIKALAAGERETLAKLVEAAKIVDALFLRQAWAGNETLLLDLLKDQTPLGRARLHYFMINKGPWSRLDEMEPFVPGVGKRPEEGNFYPAGATKADVDKWLGSLSGETAEAARGFFTTIRRQGEHFVAVPYSLEYQGELARAAQLLREAATATQQPSLKAFLEKRAAAFISNDYYDSDIAWMELDASIDPTIGPYEVYEDDWFNFKAAFEAFITVRDEVESKKLERFGAELQGLEDNLPIDPSWRKKLGGLAPIRVVNVIFCSGDGNRGVQTAAYNLPNDERVVAKMGSKRVMLKNMQEAKFAKVLLPISHATLSIAAQKEVAFDAFFTHILMHELMHGLGPQTITLGGRETTVRQELKEANGTLEEAKADISGLWALQRLVDKGVLGKEMERTMYTTFLASSFRSLRFGLAEAHGKGMAIQVNTLLDAGAFIVGADGSFSVDLAKTKEAVTALTREIMTIQATGDYAKAKEMIATRATIRPSVEALLKRLASIPVDIEPSFPTAVALARH
jgi:hypothetical protein